MKKSELRQIIREEIQNIKNLKIYGTVHKGGILLWVLTSEKSQDLENILKQKIQKLRNEFNKDSKIKNLINPLQLYLKGYREIKNGYILDNSIATKKDLTSQQIILIQNFLEKEGYEIKDLFKTKQDLSINS